jgi:arylsulfatase A-like enzyme
MERTCASDLEARPMPKTAVARAHVAMAALAAIAAALLLLSCHRQAPRPRNVIFILVDTLRADRLSGYGYARPTSPNFDAFAREAVKFDANRGQASCTFPSANSILTSRWPSAFLGQPDQRMGIPEGMPSIAEILHTRGYHTVAVSASAVVRRSPSRFNPTGGFDRGFDVFDEGCVWKSAACVNQAVAPHLRQGDKPLFLYIHYIDPHGPYQPPREWPRKFATGQPEKEWVRAGDPNPIGNWLYKGKPKPELTPADLQHLKDLYDDEIAFFDERFAELLRAIRGAGLMEDSILVFVSDHGEEFLEHGDIKHCRTLFDSSIHVPLLLKIPGVGPKTVTRPVQSLDLVPTLVDYLGIDLGVGTGGARFEGRSLRGEIEGKGRQDPQFGLQGTLRSVSDGRFKLIEDLAGGAPKLFDLQADPGETRDVLAGQRRAYFTLRDALAGWLAHSEGKDAVDASRAAQEKLRSLGYIE